MLMSIMNTSHPLHETVRTLSCCFSNRLLHPQCKKQGRYFIPAAVRLFQKQRHNAVTFLHYFIPALCNCTFKYFTCTVYPHPHILCQYYTAVYILPCAIKCISTQCNYFLLQPLQYFRSITCLKYFTSCIMRLRFVKVSLSEILLLKKFTFSHYSNFLRCICS